MGAPEAVCLAFSSVKEPNFCSSAVGGTILSITYGIDILPHNDPFLLESEENVMVVTAALVPGTFWVVRFNPSLSRPF